MPAPAPPSPPGRVGTAPLQGRGRRSSPSLAAGRQGAAAAASWDSEVVGGGASVRSRLCRLPGTLSSEALCSSRNRGPGPPPHPSRPSKCCSPEGAGNRCTQTFDRLVPEEQGRGTKDSTPPAEAGAAWGHSGGRRGLLGRLRGLWGRGGAPAAARLPACPPGQRARPFPPWSPSGPWPGCGKPAESPSAPCSLKQPEGTREHLTGDPAPGSLGPAAHTRRGTRPRLSPRGEQRAARDPSRGTSATSLRDLMLKSPFSVPVLLGSQASRLFQKLQ